VPPVIDEIRQRILQACPSISLIVLFGSRARGEAGADSDYDLLVVAPPDVPAGTRAARLRLALWDVPGSFDVVVVSETDFEATRGFRSGLVHRALAEGVVLHEAA
jgi:predicted nucleotidyltransferase